MKYNQFAPPKALKNHIQYFWSLEAKDCDSFEKTFRIIPDGLPGLIFQENMNAIQNDNKSFLPQLFLYGQTTLPVTHTAKEGFRTLGIYLQPTAIKSLFGVDANELLNSHICLNELFGTNLSEQLFCLTNPEKRIKFLSCFLMKLAAEKKTENPGILYASMQLKKGVPLKAIQHDLKISERSLQRKFKQLIGISPKLFARISRFQSALNSIRGNQVQRFTDISYQNEYFDQSHFIRDFKEFSGVNPTQFFRKSNGQLANYPEWNI